MDTLTKTDIEEEKHHHGHGAKHYVNIWFWLLVLLAASVIGPFVGPSIEEASKSAGIMFIEAWMVTLITAFGIAIYKAYLVAANFMHLNIEKRYVTYMLITMLLFMILLFAGVSPDVMKHEGVQWRNIAAELEVQRGLEETREAIETGRDKPEEPIY